MSGLDEARVQARLVGVPQVPAPEDLLDSIPDIKEIIKGFNLPVIELDGIGERLPQYGALGVGIGPVARGAES